MGNKLMQARCHLLNERILTSDNQLDEARQAFDTAQRLYQEADLLCPICQQPLGMKAESIQILTCTHIFHQRYIEKIQYHLLFFIQFLSLDVSRIYYKIGLIKLNLVPNVIKVFYSVEVISHYHVLDT
jgi:hypothetical protein